MASTRTISRRTLAGGGLAALGLLVNPWTFELLVAPDGHVETVEILGLVGALDLVLLGLGTAILLGGRPALRLVSLLLFAAAGLLGWRNYSLWRGWSQPPVRPIDELCTWLTQEEAKYLGVGRLREAQAEVARLEERNADARLLVKRSRRLADLLMRHGHVDLSIERLEKTRELARAVRLGDELESELALQLGVAFVRRGEQNHCVQEHNKQSCVFPITGAGVWPDTEAAERAIALFGERLAFAPDDAEARWLLNLAHMTAGTWPEGVGEDRVLPPEMFAVDPALEGPADATRRVDVATELGVDAFNLVGGAIVDDMDGDGLLDIVTSTYEPCGAMLYYRNAGDGTFEDRSAPSGVATQRGLFNLYQADVDNDGRLDVYGVRGAWMERFGRQRNTLLGQRADGTFVDDTVAAGLGDVADPNLAAAFADYDGDGWIDLFVGTERINGHWSGPSRLYRNDGDGTFTDVADDVGVTNLRHAKGLTWGDYDDDGDPDLFVSNYGDPNRLYRNEGGEAFTDVAVELGLDRNAPDDNTFPCWFWDVDNDGHLDLFVGGYTSRGVSEIAADYMGLEATGERMRLWRNDGAGGFEDVTAAFGLDAVREPMGANYGDVDADGWFDMYLGTGAPPFSYLVPNVLYRNLEGERFVDVTFTSGVGHLQKGHATAFGDLDNDGDQEIYHQLGGFFPDDAFANALYLAPGAPPAWLTVKLVGTRSNRAAIGARVTATLAGPGGTRRLHREVGSGGSFGASSLQVELGLGDAERVTRLEVLWPASGERQVFEDVGLNRTVVVTEGEATLGVLDRPVLSFPGG